MLAVTTPDAVGTASTSGSCCGPSEPTSSDPKWRAAGDQLVKVVVVRAGVGGIRGDTDDQNDDAREGAIPEGKAQPEGDRQPSRRTYPLPLRVWINLRSPSASSFWRSCLI